LYHAFSHAAGLRWGRGGPVAPAGAAPEGQPPRRRQHGHRDRGFSSGAPAPCKGVNPAASQELVPSLFVFSLGILFRGLCECVCCSVVNLLGYWRLDLPLGGSRSKALAGICGKLQFFMHYRSTAQPGLAADPSTESWEAVETSEEMSARRFADSSHVVALKTSMPGFVSKVSIEGFDREAWGLLNPFYNYGAAARWPDLYWGF